MNKPSIYLTLNKPTKIQVSTCCRTSKHYYENIFVRIKWCESTMSSCSCQIKSTNRNAASTIVNVSTFLGNGIANMSKWIMLFRGSLFNWPLIGFRRLFIVWVKLLFLNVIQYGTQSINLNALLVFSLW